MREIQITNLGSRGDTTLPLFSVTIGAEAQDAAQSLVNAQLHLEELARSSWGKRLIPACLVNSNGTICGWELLQASVPFLSAGGEALKRWGPAMVPLDALLGDSWRWRPQDVDTVDGPRLEQYLSDQDRALVGGPDKAEYFCLEPLGIFWVNNGNNRVQFLRSCGHSHVPGSLTVATYPSSERISLFWADVHGGTRLWAVLDNRWLTPIELPDLGLPVMQAYGVGTPEGWPSHWPSPLDVLEDLHLETLEGRHGPGKVDLNALEARRRARMGFSGSINARLIDLAGVHADFKVLARYVGAATFIATAIAALMFGPDHRVIAAVVASFIAGAMLVLTQPVLRTTNSRLTPLHLCSAEEIELKP